MSTLAAATTTTADSFSPYAFLLHGGARRSSPGAVSGMGTPSTTNADVATPESATSSLHSVLSDTEHGRALAADLEFIVPPNIEAVDQELPASSRCLFMGHLRFETTTADVRWMIKSLTGVNPLRCDIRGNGCCVIYLLNDADVTAVRALNRRVLFDHHGFWFARTPEAVDVLMDYVEQQIPALNQMPSGKRRALRLPRDALVVEDSRSSKHHRRSAVAKNQQQNQQQQVQQRPQQPQQPLQPLQPCALSTTAPPSACQTPLATPDHRRPQYHLGTPCGSVRSRGPVSPFLTHTSSAEEQYHQPQQHGQGYASFNFHECPPDYVLPQESEKPSASHCNSSAFGSRLGHAPIARLGSSSRPTY